MTLTIDLSSEIANEGVVRILSPRLNDAELNGFRHLNPHLKIERDTNGDILVMLAELPGLTVNMARVFQETI